MKIVFAGSFASRLAEPVRDLVPRTHDIRSEDEAAVLSRLADAEVLVSMGFSARMAEAAPNLRLLQVPGAGLDRVDLDALRPATRLANAYGHEVGIAEFAMGAMIVLTRSFGRLDAGLREGRWESQWAIGAEAPPLWPELAGKTLGVLGFGRIGAALARRAVAFDMPVCAVRRQAQADPPVGVEFVGGPERLEEVLGRADYLAVTLSLSRATHHLLDARRLALLKPTAFLINVARAEVIEEAALHRALATGGIAGAALDVWYRYPSSSGAAPPATSPFHELSNVIMTPHVSGWTEGMLAARAELIAENIQRTARGAPPLNEIERTARETG